MKATIHTAAAFAAPHGHSNTGAATVPSRSVAASDQKHLRILSRTPALAPELLEAALKAAAGQGYDLGQLKYTVQGSQAALPAR